MTLSRCRLARHDHGKAGVRNDFRSPGHPLRCRMNRSYLNRNPLMLRSESSNSRMKSQKRSGSLFVLSVAAFLTLLPSAFGQDFNMTVAPFNPFAVAPGEASSATISLGALNRFNPTVDRGGVTTRATRDKPPTRLIRKESAQP